MSRVFNEGMEAFAKAFNMASPVSIQLLSNHNIFDVPFMIISLGQKGELNGTKNQKVFVSVYNYYLISIEILHMLS